MVLLRDKIKSEIDAGRILIDPMPGKINPNSIDVHTGDRMFAVSSKKYILDPRRLDESIDHTEQEIYNSDSGRFWILSPGIMYLCPIMETIKTNHYVPMMEGRSSSARISLSAHRSAGFGDIGFAGKWVMEIDVMIRQRLYVGSSVAQISFWSGDNGGAPVIPYSGKYQGGRIFSGGIE